MCLGQNLFVYCRTYCRWSAYCCRLVGCWGWVVWGGGWLFLAVWCEYLISCLCKCAIERLIVCFGESSVKVAEFVVVGL